MEVCYVMTNEYTSGKRFVSKPGIFSLTTVPGDCSLFVSRRHKGLGCRADTFKGRPFGKVA